MQLHSKRSSAERMLTLHSTPAEPPACMLCKLFVLLGALTFCSASELASTGLRQRSGFKLGESAATTSPFEPRIVELSSSSHSDSDEDAEKNNSDIATTAAKESAKQSSSLVSHSLSSGTAATNANLDGTALSTKAFQMIEKYLTSMCPTGSKKFYMRLWYAISVMPMSAFAVLLTNHSSFSVAIGNLIKVFQISPYSMLLMYGVVFQALNTIRALYTQNVVLSKQNKTAEYEAFKATMSIFGFFISLSQLGIINAISNNDTDASILGPFAYALPVMGFEFGVFLLLFPLLSAIHEAQLGNLSNSINV